MPVLFGPFNSPDDMHGERKTNNFQESETDNFHDTDVLFGTCVVK